MSVHVVQIPRDFPPKWDLADPSPPGADLEALLDAAIAPPTVPAGRLRGFITTAADFARQELPPREYVVEPFLPSSSLSMVFAARGVGKTWFALSLASAVSKGEPFLSFDVPKPRTVLVIDGEMALAELQSRIRDLDPAPSDNLLLLPSERLFREDRPLNINATEDQQAVEQAIEDLRSEGKPPELVIFDNLSSLSGGIDENDNSALDALLRWLIGLRHKGLAVVLVHHAGKSGDQRGASRREDLLDTSIKLSKKKEDEDEDAPPMPEGASFTVEFVKTRGRMPNPSKFEMCLSEGEDGSLGWIVENGIQPTAKDKVLKAIALRPPRKQADLCDALDLTKGAVSQHCRKLKADGLIENLAVTEKGRVRLLRIWPDLEAQLELPEDLPF